MVSVVLILSATLNHRMAIITGSIAVCTASVCAVLLMRTVPYGVEFRSLGIITPLHVIQQLISQLPHPWLCRPLLLGFAPLLVVAFSHLSLKLSFPSTLGTTNQLLTYYFVVGQV